MTSSTGLLLAIIAGGSAFLTVQRFCCALNKRFAGLRNLIVGWLTSPNPYLEYGHRYRRQILSLFGSHILSVRWIASSSLFFVFSAAIVVPLLLVATNLYQTYLTVEFPFALAYWAQDTGA